MSNQGWIKIHRKLEESVIFSSEKGLKIWIWCLLKANHEEADFYIGRQKIHLKPGQFVTGKNVAKEQLNMAVGTIWFWLDQLVVERSIERKSTNKYSVITILNWNKYQIVEPKLYNRLNADRTTDGQQIEPNNNNNNVENKKKIISKDITKSSFGNPDINEIIEYFKTTLRLPILDGSVQQNRNYANLCIKKFGGIDKVKLLIDSTKSNQFWSTKVTSFMTLYYKGVNIISSNRNQKGSVLKL